MHTAKALASERLVSRFLSANRHEAPLLKRAPTKLTEHQLHLGPTWNLLLPLVHEGTLLALKEKHGHPASHKTFDLQSALPER